MRPRTIKNKQDGTKERAFFYLSILALLVLAVIFIRLFTKPVSSDGQVTANEKIRINLIRFSYIFMFFAIGAAILPFISEWRLESKRDTNQPISIFLGCSKDAEAGELACSVENPDDKANPVQKRQWVVNIGGRLTDCSGAKDKTCVEGGLVVPLYFVILALIGGAVSLTRRVPEYQKRSAPSYTGTEKEPRLDIETLREWLVFQIVQFLSAPLIAVVAYYLISPDNRAYVVALGFTAGFASESILVMIRSVVEKVKPTGVTGLRTGMVAGNVTDSGTQKAVAKAKVTVAGKPALKDETDNNGHFVIHDVSVGDQLLEISDDKGRTRLAKVAVDAAKTSVCHGELP